MIEVRTIEPTVDALELAEVKDHLRVEHNEQDVYIHTLMKAAERYVEEETHRGIMAQTYTCYYDTLPSVIKLGHQPVLEGTSIKYLDTGSPITQQTMAASVYRVDTVRAQIIRAPGQVWPNHTVTSNAIEIAYRVGYVDTDQSPHAGSVPEDLKWLMFMIVDHAYQYSGSVVDTQWIAELPFGLKQVLHRYRLYR